MKKVIKFIIIVLGFLFLIGNLTFAVSIQNPLKYGTVPEVIAAIANFVFIIAIPITSLMVVIGGVMFMISGGDPKKVEQAKKLLLYAVIGLAIILLSKTIAAVIENVLTS